MFYLSSKQIELTGASPETLIKLEDKELKTFPIAGTMPRGKDEREDDLLKTRQPLLLRRKGCTIQYEKRSYFPNILFINDIEPVSILPKTSWLNAME